jgi:hypothetical protein
MRKQLDSIYGCGHHAIYSTYEFLRRRRVTRPSPFPHPDKVELFMLRKVQVWGEGNSHTNQSAIHWGYKMSIASFLNNLTIPRENGMAQV